jgi:hypothetical protein
MGMAGVAKKAISDVRAAALPGECRTKFRQARLQSCGKKNPAIAPFCSRDNGIARGACLTC